MPPPGISAICGNPARSEVVPAGILYATQWKNVPPGASGSSTINAKVTADFGAPLHVSSGDRSPPVQANSPGIAAPGAIEGLVKVSCDCASVNAGNSTRSMINPANIKENFG